MLLLVNNVHKKHPQKVKTRNFESVCALSLICTPVTTLPRPVLRLCTRLSTLLSCYMTMQSFSVSQKRVFFSHVHYLNIYV